MDICLSFARKGDIRQLEWQRFVLEKWLGTKEDGTWAASTCGLFVARQNGKSEGVLLLRAALGLLYLGERIIFTSHRQDAATEFYSSLKQFLDREEFRRFVEADGFRGALGRERINMRSGAFIQFVARSNKGGRSKHSDLIIFDEAQYLDHSEQASFTPTQETSPNPQIIYAGTPPDKPGIGHEFAGVRRRALRDRNPGIAWCEWAVNEYPKDVTDRALWYETNPSLGTLIPEKNIELQLNNLDADDFAREVLCWWPPEKLAEASAIPISEWRACAVDRAPEPTDDERLCAGIKFSPDGSTYALSVAARRPDGPVLVECLERDTTNRGISHLVDWIADRRGVLSLVAIDGREWTATLSQRLSDINYPKRGWHTMRTTEVIDACAMLSGAVVGRTVTHIEQPLLTQSVETSIRRQIGRDGWAFQGPDPTPVESVALAYWGAMTSKRNPRRKQMVAV